MSFFRIEIATDNDAFADGNFEMEVARILDVVKNKVQRGVIAAPIHDANGNTVGDFAYTEN
jgi:hypothetical protein